MIGASQLLARFSFLLYFFIYRYALENHAKALASFPQRTIRTILKKILAGAWVITGCKHPTQAKSCKTISCFSHCKRRYTSVLAMSAFESVVSFQAAAPPAHRIYSREDTSGPAPSPPKPQHNRAAVSL